MLGEGIKAGFAALGIEYRTVAYVERDGRAAANLVARMEGQALAPAPVWDDLTTFPGRSFRGAVDLVAAGFPCQDLSVAGARAGLDGKRSGLFFKVLDVADACEASLLFLENVAGITSAGAAVVGEAEFADWGGAIERASSRVVGELADRGWSAEWLHLSAAEVGASHGRERWFCFAWRSGMADSERKGRRSPPESDQSGRRSVGAQEGSRSSQCGGDAAGRFEQRSGLLANTCSERRQQVAGGPHGDEGADEGRRQNTADQPAGSVEDVEHAEGLRRRQGWPESGGEQGRSAAAEYGGEMADTARIPSRERPGRERVFEGNSPVVADDEQPTMADAEYSAARRGISGVIGDSAGTVGSGLFGSRERGGTLANTSDPRLQGYEQRVTSEPQHRQPASGSTAELHRTLLFAPGPADARWRDIIESHPDLAPSTEPGLRVLADGVAYLVDESRADQLRCGGNGVVALCAAVAVVELVRRARQY